MSDKSQFCYINSSNEKEFKEGKRMDFQVLSRPQKNEVSGDLYLCFYGVMRHVA